MALTDDNNMVMPVAPAYGNQGGFGGFGGDGWWVILLFILLGNNGWGGFGGGFGGFGNMYEFPWLLNGQNGINNNTNDGFRAAQLQDSITSVRDGISGLSTQLCGCCGDMQMSLANGFAGTTAAITGAQNAISQQMYSNELASLNRSFAEQTANTQGFNNIQGQLAQCCSDNRLASADLKYTIATENCADRTQSMQNTRDIIDSQTRGTQAILDKLCQLELDNYKTQIDAKNDLIAQLRQENLYARGQASQDVQTARLLAGQTAEVDALYNRLNSCPVPTTPVYGRTPIFNCNNNGCGCGCGVG